MITVVATKVNSLDVIDALGTRAGEAFLEALEGFAVAQLPPGHPLAEDQAGIARVLSYMATGGIDVGNAQVRYFLQVFAQLGILAPASVAAVLALAERDVPGDLGEITQVVLVADQPCAADPELAVKTGGDYTPTSLVEVYSVQDPEKIARSAFPAYYIAFGVMP